MILAALPDLLLAALFGAIWGTLAGLIRSQGYLVTGAYIVVSILGFLTADAIARVLQLPIPGIGDVHPVEASLGSAALLSLAWLIRSG